MQVSMRPQIAYAGVIRVLQRRAYDLRDEEYLRLNILACMLREPDVTKVVSSAESVGERPQHDKSRNGSKLALWSLDILRTGSGKRRDFIRITRPLVHDRRPGAITSQNPYAYRFLERTAGEGLTVVGRQPKQPFQGWGCAWAHTPRVARGAQPWAK